MQFDGRRRERLVANCKVTIGLLEAEIWSGVVYTDIVRIALFLTILNDTKILAVNICSAYLMVDSRGKICTKLGPEFGDWVDKTIIIKKRLYDLIGSCA